MAKNTLEDIKKKLRKYGLTGRLSEEEICLWAEHGFNKLCESCKKTCKQHGGCEIIKCPLYEKA